MKRIFLALLTTLMLVIPAYAAESGDDTVVDQPIQQEPVVVGTLEELQAAVDAAEDGDIIYLSATIGISGKTIETDKSLTIATGNDNNGELLRLYDGATVRGFCFSETNFSGRSFLAINNATNDGVIVENCTFEYVGDDIVDFIHIYGDLDINRAYIRRCTFNGATHGAVSTLTHTDVEIDSCVFTENQNYMSGGAISSSGKLYVKNSFFADNSAGSAGSILATNDLTIDNCHFSGNTIDQNGIGRDILSTEKTTIVSAADSHFDFYNEITGEKVDLPLIDSEGMAQLIYLTEEQAEEYFAPEPPNGEEPTPPEQPQPPQQPGDQTGDDDTTGGEQPPQEPTQPPETNPDDSEQGQPQEPEQPPQVDPTEQPTEPEQPPEGEGKDDPTETPPEAPEQPVEPPQDDTPTTTPDTPQQPQEPADGSNGNNDNYTPPIDYYPIYRPLWPVVTVKPTEDSKPQTQPDSTPAPAKPQLVCNGAVIDTSRTVVLLGYGDGLTHENDPLTRAQLATIIYRLLDDESIAKYSNSTLEFTDVAPDAWYTPYVRVIQAAGIVNGVGGGRYDPDGAVTWSQIVTILTRFVEPQEYTLQHIQYSGWAEQAIQTAVANGWIADRADFTPDAIISRGQLEQLINSVLALYR